jgi:hypothetical protein
VPYLRRADLDLPDQVIVVDLCMCAKGGWLGREEVKRKGERSREGGRKERNEEGRRAMTMRMRCLPTHTLIKITPLT